MNITNDIITSYIDTLYKGGDQDMVVLREFAEANHVPIILKDTEGLLLNLFKIKKPSRILEIGAAIGYSSCTFARACDCHVTTIEADEETYHVAQTNIKNLGCDDKVDILLGDAREVLSELSHKVTAEESQLYDIVFIDAAKSHYRAFWDLSLPLCKDDAIIVCDNVLMKGMTASDEYDPKRKYKTSIRKMREFIDYITNLDYADTCVIPVGDGISISCINK
jgi:predicted O-methyltransferase YrrM